MSLGINTILVNGYSQGAISSLCLVSFKGLSSKSEVISGHNGDFGAAP